MEAAATVHTNGLDAGDAATTAIPPHIAALTTCDAVEAHTRSIQRQLSSLPPSDPSLPALRQELLHCSAQMAAVRANGRYLALLSCAALLVLVIVMMLLGWRLPIVAVHEAFNEVRQQRMAHLGVHETDLPVDNNDFSAAFNWVTWLLGKPGGGGGGSEPT